MLPAADVKAAERPARNTFSPRVFPGRQITAATITDTKVIKKFTGRVIFKIAVSFSSNSNKKFVKDSLKLTKRKRYATTTRG